VDIHSSVADHRGELGPDLMSLLIPLERTDEPKS